MLKNSTYSRKVSESIFIENGIISGTAPPLSMKHNSFGEMVLEKMRADPGFVGQVDGSTGREETFGEMTDKSVRCAIWLREQNVKPGDIVGICTHNQTDMYVPCFASLYIGAVYNAWWDIGLTKDLAKHFLRLTEPKVVFVSGATRSIVVEAIREMAWDTKIVVFGKNEDSESLEKILESQSRKNVGNFRCAKLSSLEEPAVIIYTSGSTGMPKGVLFSNESIFYNIDRFGKVGGEMEAVTLIFSPLAWLSGIITMLRGVVRPDRRIIYPEFDEEKCFQLVEKYKVNWMILGVSTALRLQRSPFLLKYDSSSLKMILVGGSVLEENQQSAIAKAFPRTFICQGYGSTELGNIGVMQSRNFRRGSCGQVVGNISVKIVDPETGRTLNPNEKGETCFKNPYMMKGYYRNPEATKNTIDSEGWLHTGDLMYYDEEGHLYFEDRLKELIKYRGYHVSPTMIEQLLQTHPDIYEAAVSSIPHEIDEEHPVAFVVRNPGARITGAEIEKMVAESLPDYMKLRGGVKFLNELPRTASEKVAKTVLKNLAKSYAE